VAWTKEKIDWKRLSIAKLPKDIQNALGEAEKAMELAAEKQKAARKLITAKLPKAPPGKVARVAITLRDGDVRVAVGLATANEKSRHDATGLDSRRHPRHPHELRGVPIIKTPSTSETLKRRQCQIGISNRARPSKRRPRRRYLQSSPSFRQVSRGISISLHEPIAPGTSPSASLSDGAFPSLPFKWLTRAVFWHSRAKRHPRSRLWVRFRFRSLHTRKRTTCSVSLRKSRP
jgi:hypothetical protein